MKFRLLVLIAVATGLSGCGDFEAIKPDLEQIVSIKNTDFRVANIDPADTEPEPLPIAPEISGMPEDEGSVDAQRANPDITTYPYTTFGKLTYRKGGKNWECSGEIVGEGDVLMTAAHCVFDEDTGQWATDFTFYRGYKDGSYAGAYGWKCAAMFSGWAYGAWRKDYAFLKLRGLSPHKLGLRPNSTATTFTSVGYPSNFDNGELLNSFTGTKGITFGGIIQMRGNPFGPGSSGGAWIVQESPQLWYAVGLNSHGRSNYPNSMFGPAFDAQTVRLYEFTRRGCEHDVFPLGQNPIVVSAAKDKGLIAADPSGVKYGPTLASRKSNKCTCEGAEEWFLESSDADYDVTLSMGAFSGDEAKFMSDNVVGISSDRGATPRSLGCTKGAPDGSSCSVALDYTITSLSRRVEVEMNGQKSRTAVTPDFCRQQCLNNPDGGYCLEFGSAGKPILASLAGFMTDALDRQPGVDGETATKTELITRFGGDSTKEDPCRRGDFYRRTDIVANEGLACIIVTASISDQPIEARLGLRTPPNALATRTANAGGTGSAAAFIDRSRGPIMEFFAEQGAPDDLNKAYGGGVKYAERRDGRMIVTTENGCLIGDDS